MFEILSILAVGLAPVIFLFTYIYNRDQYDREPLRNLIICFVLGIATAFPAAFLEGFLEDTLGLHTGEHWIKTLLYALFVVAFVEEGVKYLVLRFYIYPKKDFDEPYDGIMYAVAISLGFAAIENIMYIWSMGMGTGFLRMFTAVPGHAMFAVVMGYFVGRAKFLGPNGNPFLERTKGLAAATVIHGLYDFFLFLENTYIFITLLAFVVLIVGIRLGLKALNIHNQDSPFKDGIKEPDFQEQDMPDELHQKILQEMESEEHGGNENQGGMNLGGDDNKRGGNDDLPPRDLPPRGGGRG